MRHDNVNSSQTAESRADNTAHGMYLGVVIQNNDPKRAGRCKVWVPDVSPTVYDNWQSSNQDKKVNLVGRNIDSDISDVLEELKKIVPWAESASPIMGESNKGKYNAFTQKNVEENVPGRAFEDQESKASDAFVNAAEVPFNRANKYGHNFTPSSLGDAAKGSFSVPGVGAHVWVFFEKGDPNHPVFFAAHFGVADWQGVIDENDYPGSYENKSQAAEDQYSNDSGTYRNKYIFHQKGGTFEIVNTDDREAVKISQFGGSFKEIGTDVSSELAVGNDQKLVQGHSFITVQGDESSFTGGDRDSIVVGDDYQKVGNLEYELHLKWKELLQGVADANQLFETKRAEVEEDPNNLLKHTSYAQTRKGKFAPCPLCVDGDRAQIWNNVYSLSALNLPETISDANGNNAPVNALSAVFTFNNITSNAGVSAQPAQPRPHPRNFLRGGNCPVCGGTGLSPSSKDGSWEIEDKATLVAERLKLIASDLIALEKKMGRGGSVITNVTKHRVDNIGLVMNDFPSYRLDKTGKIEESEVRVFPGGVTKSFEATPLLEYVNVDELPGGTLTQNVANKWHMNVGAGGVDLKTQGGLDLGGSITNLAGLQTNIAGGYEVNVASQRVDIQADNIRIKNRKNGQILIDGNLGVSQNVAIAGSMHVEGELTLSHVTAPVEIQETQQTNVLAETVGNKILGYSTAGTVSINSITFAAGSQGTVVEVDDLNENGEYEFEVVRSDSSTINTRVKVEANSQTLTEYGRTGSISNDFGEFVIDTTANKVGFEVTTTLAGTINGVKVVSSSTAPVRPVYGLGKGDVATGTRGTTVTGQADSVVVYPHSHQFANMPLKLLARKDDVRKVGSLVNQEGIGVAVPVIHEKKYPESLT